MRDRSPEVSGGEATGGRHLWGRLSSAVWLAFIVYPLAASYTDPRLGTFHLVVVSTVAAGFSAVYIAYCALPDPARSRTDRRYLVGVVVILAAAISFLVFYDSAAWDYSYVYCLWPAIVLTGFKPWAVPLLAGLVVAIGAVAGLEERVVAAGGVLETTAGSDGGFCLSVSIPMSAPPSRHPALLSPPTSAAVS
ncbi:MAG: hypothetical protein ACYCV7_03335 [Acidimicrobiales bacterium]